MGRHIPVLGVPVSFRTFEWLSSLGWKNGIFPQERHRGKGRKERRNARMSPEVRGKGLVKDLGPVSNHRPSPGGTRSTKPLAPLPPQRLQPTGGEGRGARFSTSWASGVFLNPYSSSHLPEREDPHKPVLQLSQLHAILEKNEPSAAGT